MVNAISQYLKALQGLIRVGKVDSGSPIIKFHTNFVPLQVIYENIPTYTHVSYSSYVAFHCA